MDGDGTDPDLIDWAAFWRRHEGWDEVEEWRDAQLRRQGVRVPYVPRVSEVSAELMIEQLRRERQTNELFPSWAKVLLEYLDHRN